MHFHVDGSPFGWMTISASLTTTFADVKHLVQGELGVPYSWQAFSNPDSDKVCDSQTIQQLLAGFRTGILFLHSRHGPLRVSRCRWGPFLPIDIFPVHDSVMNVKQRIEHNEFIPVATQRLLFQGSELLDDLQLADLPGETDVLSPCPPVTILRVVIREPEPIRVRLQAIDGRSISLFARTSDTVLELKAQIDEAEAIPIDQQFLFWGCRDMQNDQILAYYDLQNGSILHLRNPRGSGSYSTETPPALAASSIMITLENLDDGTLSSVRVCLTDPISSVAPSLKWAAESGVGVRAWLGGDLLKSCKSFQEYSIRNGTVLHLETGIRIFVKNLPRPPLTLYVPPATSIEEIKRLISRKEGIPPDLQTLIFNGRPLEDENTLERRSIRGDCTLYLVSMVRD
jgi:hypothetical protein